MVGNCGAWFAHAAISASLTICTANPETGECIIEVFFYNQSNFEITKIEIGKSSTGSEKCIIYILQILFSIFQNVKI